MIFRRIIILLIVLPLIVANIYLFNTEDSLSVEFYDCIYNGIFTYLCRRPGGPISLHRNNSVRKCYHDGIMHSFASLWSNNISLYTVLHKWNSSIEMAEEYSRYVRDPLRNDNEKYLCQCTNRQSFGKNCEYLLPQGFTFEDTVKWEIEMRRKYPKKAQIYSDILCYTTLICNSGLLCLDWRDICDRFQQCMLGLDEENCDLIEFNECSYDEYRCMNGMCIPQEYFLDGEYDCMDFTDEKQLFDDTICTLEIVSFICDDRICSPNTWSCGDGQCILDRLSFQTDESLNGECESKRDQYYICETHISYRQWTLPNGKCHLSNPHEPLVIRNESMINDCEYFVKCALSYGSENDCPCQQDMSCINQLENSCNSTMIQYPNNGIIAPYIFYFYNTSRDWSDNIPDLIVFNGTIKCRGYMITQYLTLHSLSNLNLNTIEDFVCNSPSNSSMDMNRGYHEFCHNDSRTFNNHSYHFIDVCKYSRECISAYRIVDGYTNCVDKMDEKQYELVSDTCDRIKHYRFRCSSEELTCLIVNHIGNLLGNCKNIRDEFSTETDTLLSKMNCNYQSKDDCKFIRQYIETSWNIDNNTMIEFKSTTSIPFRAYCDTLWDLRSNVDEYIPMCRRWWVCREDQWQCRTGQCIPIRWVLDKTWDCSDASDEQAIFFNETAFSSHNSKLSKHLSIELIFNGLYSNASLSTICNPIREFPCVRINVSNSTDNILHNRFCISLEKIGDNIVDCLGGLDERNTLKHCNGITMLGSMYKCLTSNTCLTISQICDVRCPNKSDDDEVCFGKEKMENCSESTTDFMCLNGHCAKNGWCDQKRDCLHKEDEYLCVNLFPDDSTHTEFYNNERKVSSICDQYKLQLPDLPILKNENKIIVMTSLITQSTPLMIDSSESESLVSYRCSRGVGILMYNDSIICFCPPQYYGDRCQFHSDRISIILQVNFSNSIYEKSNDRTVILKFLVLFLLNNETLTSYEFDVQPVIEITNPSKKINHLLYSRSNKSLYNKQMRYFNRSNIINDHPYSVRIEGYELKINNKPQLIAVWEYPVYFDYLPNFRLAKILRLTKPDIHHKNPCSSNPCSWYQECHQLLNQNSRYVCLCPHNYRGKDCLIYDEMCSNSFCSTNALCKPNYRNLLQGNETPHCICSIYTFGPRCELKYDLCNSNPCRNNGSCFPTTKFDEYICICNSFYSGVNCERKNELMNIYINQSVEHRGAVVQHFYIDFCPNDLYLVYQRSFHNLPNHFELYLPDMPFKSGFIIVKLYFSTQVGFYLISSYNSLKSFNGTTQINEKFRCVDVRTLFETNDEISPYKYHYLCIKNKTLLCFYDKTYLCICADDNSRAECFIYDQYLDYCSNCFSDSLCLKGDHLQLNDFICICQRCRYGYLCQFSTEQLSFTLDALIVYNHFNIQLLYFILTIIIFLIGLITNYASFVTFKRRNPRKVGVGYYLLILSLFSQCSLLSILLKMNYILFGSLLGNIPCKIITYMLSITTRYSYWLTSWITINRVHLTLFPFSTMIKKPRLAIIISLMTLLVICVMHIHELLFYISLKDSSEQTVCVTTITKEMSIYNRVTVLIHYIVPFSIQVVSITLLIAFAARSRSRAASKQGRFIQQVKQQFQCQKELYITPVIIILSGLPQIILSFTFACIELSLWQRHALLVTYFLSYAPQVLGFVLFVLPSTNYLHEFKQTKLAKMCLFRWILQNKKPPAINNNQHPIVGQKVQT